LTRYTIGPGVAPEAVAVAIWTADPESTAYNKPFLGMSACAEALAVPVPKSVIVNTGNSAPTTIFVPCGMRFSCITLKVRLCPIVSMGENACTLIIRRLSLELMVFRAPEMSPTVRAAPDAFVIINQRVIHLFAPIRVAGGSPTAERSVIFITSCCFLGPFLGRLEFTIF
jgi:hypothetical protein